MAATSSMSWRYSCACGCGAQAMVREWVEQAAEAHTRATGHEVAFAALPLVLGPVNLERDFYDRVPRGGAE